MLVPNDAESGPLIENPKPRIEINPLLYKRNQHWWTPEQDAILREWRGAGKSSSQIAAEIGCSRNGVIGRAHRLGLESTKARKQERTATLNSGRRMNVPRKAAAPALSPNKILPPKPIFFGLDLMTLKTNQCRDPGESNGPFLFCGQPTGEDSSYCVYHHELNHTESRKTTRPIVAAQSTQILEAAE